MAERPLHIAVDGRELLGKSTGVGRYVAEVIRAWDADPGADRLSVVVPSTPPSTTGLANVHWVVTPAQKAGTWWEQTALPRSVERLGADVLFAPGYTAPLRLKIPFVLTIHDVSFFAHPEWFSTREGVRRRWLTRASARRAAVVTTVSEFSKAEIVRWLAVPADRIVVAPNGVPPIDSAAPIDRPPVVLFVGSLFNRRRIPDLMRGFALAAREVDGARLVLVGDNRTRPHQDPMTLAHELGLGGRVEWHAWVDEDRLRREYARARVFAFLSDYEGFGLTPLEAIAQGVPAVVLDTALSREVYGSGARLVPAEPAAIATALVSLLTDAEAHRQALEAGRRQLARYSWARTGAVLRKALQQAAWS